MKKSCPRLFILGAVLGTGLFGCGNRAYMTPSHGTSYRDVFTKQGANPNAGADHKATKGLDSQEASIVSRTYRQGFAPQGTAVREESMLLVNPSKAAGAAAAYMPPPSVPAEKN
jgi:hypothetical protein